MPLCAPPLESTGCYGCAFFAAAQHPDIAAYYSRLLHRGILHRDLIRDREGRGEFPPAAILRSSVPSEARGEVERQLIPMLAAVAESNFLLLRDRETVD